MTAFEERHAELISLIRLSKLERELHSKTTALINEAIENPTPEAIDEVLLSLGEYQLVKNELREKVMD